MVPLLNIGKAQRFALNTQRQLASGNCESHSRRGQPPSGAQRNRRAIFRL